MDHVTAKSKRRRSGAERDVLTRLAEAEELIQRLRGQQQLLVPAGEELQRSNRELEQFAYVISHDLQEPLRSVSSFLQLIDERYKGQLEKTGQEYVDYALQGARRMSDMIRDLLSYSRVRRKENGQTPADAEHCLAAALANLEAAIGEAGARITHDPLPSPMIDAVQLTQLFQNLVGNAVKFRRSDRPCRVHVGSGRRDAFWVFSVRDNGIGIPPDQHDRVFEIFRSLHPRGKYPGTGMGLALCKKIVQQHGGEIWIESSPGDGATIHFSLPAGEGR